MHHYFAILTLIRLVKSEKEFLVVNGEIGQIRQFPHSAFLKVACHQRYHSGWICGASIINQRILLTAAHCVSSCTGQNTMSVSVGHKHLKKGTVSSVHSTLPHRQYSTDNFDYDIALIKLFTDLKFNSKVQRVALMKRPPYFEKAQLAGWGYIQDNPIKNTNLLHYVDQYVWTTDRCLKFNEDLDPGTFCASSKKKGAAPSGGDSGSALVVRGYIQIGVVAYRMPTFSRLVVYTDTGFFYDWISNNTKNLYCSAE